MVDQTNASLSPTLAGIDPRRQALSQLAGLLETAMFLKCRVRDDGGQWRIHSERADDANGVLSVVCSMGDDTILPSIELIRAQSGVRIDLDTISQQLSRVNERIRVCKPPEGKNPNQISLWVALDVVAKPLAQSRQRSLVNSLYDLSRYYFRAAWDDDPQFVNQLARHLDVASFQQVVELVYFILSGDLGEMRNRADERVMAFFGRYPNASLGRILDELKAMDGARMNALQREARKFYSILRKHFGTFLRQSVKWGSTVESVPVYKLFFANFYALEKIMPDLMKNDEFARSVTVLNQQAAQVSQALMGVPALVQTIS